MVGGENLFGLSAASVALVALALALLAVGGAVYLLARQQRLAAQYRHLVTGTSGGNLEGMLNDHIAQVRETAVQAQAADQLAHHLQEKSSHSLRHVGVVRFNPFHNTGGDQSFALALADDHGDGLVLSSLYARDVTRVYAKPLNQWGSTYSLTEEERQAIARARETAS